MLRNKSHFKSAHLFYSLLKMFSWSSFIFLMAWGCSLRPIKGTTTSTTATAKESNLPLKENILVTLSMQQEVADHFQKFLEAWKMNSVSSAPPTPELKEKIQQSAEAFRDWFLKIEEIRIGGEDLFDNLEREAQALKDVDKKSDSYRKMIKGKRKFRLMYLTMQEASKNSARWLKKCLQTMQTAEGPKANLKMLESQLSSLEKKMDQSSLQGKGFINNILEVSGN